MPRTGANLILLIAKQINISQEGWPKMRGGQKLDFAQIQDPRSDPHTQIPGQQGWWKENFGSDLMT